MSFARLHLVQKFAEARIVLVHLHADAGQLRQDVGAAGLIGHKQLALIAYAFGRHMLVGARLFAHGGSVNAALMREGGFADIGRMPVRLAVQKLVEVNARPRSACEGLAALMPVSKRLA